MIEQVLLADRLGLDLVGIQDHPYQRRFLDTWTLLSFLAGGPSASASFPDVANLPLRHPAVLAKSAASLDRLSGGRAELGLGAGAFWEAIEAWGAAAARAPGSRSTRSPRRSRSSAACGRRAGGIRFHGAHYRPQGGARRSRPGAPAWASGSARTARGCCAWWGGRRDGWIPSLPRLPLEDVPRARPAIDDAARARRPRPGRHLCASRTSTGRSPTARSRAGCTAPWSTGWRSRRGSSADLRFDGFVVSAENHEDQLFEQTKRFATEVVAVVRAALS